MLKFAKSQPVLFISALAALGTMLIVPPDKGYADYINLTVLIQLFGLMTAVAGLRSVGLFDRLTEILLSKAGTVRRLGAVFILLCFFSSMLVTNDVALLTFVPLTLLVCRAIPDEKSRILMIVLETAAANLGSMLTPVGNPQNLYLYNEFQLTALSFVQTLLPAGIIGGAVLLLLNMMLPNEGCSGASSSEKAKIRAIPAAGYGILFVICLLTVFRVLPDWACLLAAVVIGLAFDRKLLLKVDYALLATFVCFFVFTGNIARIDAVSSFFSRILSGNEILVSALLSQVISNVPAAVMLSGFTDKGTALLLGVDLGGLGTIIASLASLISFQFYRKAENARPVKYLAVFSAVNFGMLIPLLLIHIFRLHN